MGRIAILDETTAGRIAAGEVVERPASVVKELVENALDAGASRVEVELEDGGRSLIRVSDDGEGMDSEDAVLAFQRHATSKLTQAVDLEKVQSYGFRGEALPSIASVARVRLLTSVAGAVEGTEVTAENGRVLSAGPGPARPGTVIWVRDLFHNTPARRSSLRSASAETARVAEVTATLALARPWAAVSLVSNNRLLWATPGAGDLVGPAAAVFGSSFAGGLVVVDGSAGGIRVVGLTGKPGVYRRDGKRQYVSVNGRPIGPQSLRRAAEQAYETLLPTGGTPVFILDVVLPPELVDVNLHPAKTYVRFRDHGAVHRAVLSALRAALGEAEFHGRFGGEQDRTTGSMAAASGSGLPAGSAMPDDWRQAIAVDLWGLVGEGRPGLQGGLAGQSLPDLEPLGQVDESFIVARGGDGLYVIDQHAAAERVCYDRLMAAPDEAAQILVTPEVVELTPSEAQALEGTLDFIKSVGLEVEPFGQRAVVVRAVPAVLSGVQAGRLLLDYLDRLGEEGEGRSFDRLRAVRIMAACRAALKAGQKLSLEEMAVLIAELRQATEPRTCPHGRPTVLRVGVEELRREFGR